MDVDTDGLPTDDVIAIPLPRPDAGPATLPSPRPPMLLVRGRSSDRSPRLLAHLAAGSLALEAGALEASRLMMRT